ncbi:MAG: hypothetical protein RLZZ347_568 [Candidatus Parcubacteria bacterium]|jgi:hypothetical protein
MNALVIVFGEGSLRYFVVHTPPGEQMSHDTARRIINGPLAAMQDALTAELGQPGVESHE